MIEIIPRLEVIFVGTDSTLNIHESFRVKKHCKLSIGQGFEMNLGKNVMFDNLWADFTVENLKFTVDDGSHIIGADIFASGKPGLAITIGKNCLFSRKIVIRPTDGHTIFDVNNPEIVLNEPMTGITVGNHVWIGEDVILTKDTIIPDDCVVGAHAVVTSSKSTPFVPNSVIAGVPAKTIRTGINWDKSRIDKYIDKYCVKKND